MEQVAIVGISCRFPRANSPEDFWQLLREGKDAITEVPQERWSIEGFYAPELATSGKMNTRWGGFIDNADLFDASFFGISPREAERIDPQQRLLLEVTWEALENSGIVPKQLAGSKTGVFVGISNYDYSRLIGQDISNWDAYSGTGTALSIAANRISYTLDLQGPSIAIDTACSSSLVAVHLACQSLQTGESSLCLAGGVNLILSPEITITFSQAQMMAGDGRCKTFDASANGFVRGEGCGIVVLKRLSEAIQDKDNILAIIRGSAVNQDGLTNGITAPNGPSQQKVIREALQNAGVPPEEISYLEAHGTGTALGDPVEVKSLKAVLMGNRQPEQTCWLSSVKTNIGHLESAAGIASLIKVILALQHTEIPRHLHFQKLNPYISLEGTTFKIPTTCQTWETDNQPRLAGISGFGFGGTNCHLILQEYNAPVKEKAELQRTVPAYNLLPLSAKSEEALKALAGKYLDFLSANSEVSWADICFTASTKRSHFPHRLGVIADSKKQLQEKLAGFLQGETVVGLVTGKVRPRKLPKIAFLFTGQGSQYVGMGKQLYDTQPTFRRKLDRCNEILNSYLDIDLLKVIYSDNPDDSPISETAYTQPVLFALEYALAQLWISWGIEPTVVMGHSVGEYVAATIAGVFSLEDGLKLIAARGRLMQALPCNGSMFAIMTTESQAKEAIQGYEPEVSLAAINGPQSIVISGQKDAVEAVVNRLEAEGVKTKQLAVSHAFHSPLMEPMLAAFKQIADEISYHKPTIKVISNVTGKEATAEIATPEYWCNHIRQPVRFADSMETLQQQGYQVFLEIGSKPILLGMGCQCLPEDVGVWLPSLRPPQADWQQLLQSLGELYVRGVPIDWSGFYQHYPCYRVELPTYPFQRQRYWLETAENRHQKAGVLSQKEPQTPLVKLLNQGDTEKIAQQLEKAGELSVDEVKLLPKLVELLSELVGKAELQKKTEEERTAQRHELLQKLEEASASERQSLLVTYLQEQVAKALGLLRASQLDVQQPLNNMGLDSLMAVELRNRINKDLKLDIPIVKFMEDISVVSLATYFSERMTEAPYYISYTATPIQDEYKADQINVGKELHQLSYGQRALWFLYQLAPESAAYNIMYAARLQSDLDIKALRQAFEALIERHPALRTTYTTRDGEPIQEVHKDQPIHFQEVTEASSWSQDYLNNWMVEQADRPFDLEQGPLLRVNLLTRSSDTKVQAGNEPILLLAVHHIAVDFWTLEILINELCVLYKAIKANAKASLPPLSCQYKDFVQWEAEKLASAEGERMWEYWRKQLDGELPVLNLPTDRPRPLVQTYSGSSCFFELDEKLTLRLRELAKTEGATLYMTILAAFQVLLLRYCGQEDILIGSPLATRSLAELERIVGYFVNPVVLRADLSGNPTFKDLLQRLRRVVLGALEHQDFPFPLIVERLQSIRDPSRSPLFQVSLAWERSRQIGNNKEEQRNVEGLILKSLISEQRGAIFDLSLTIYDTGEALRGSWGYNTDLFEETTIDRMSKHFQTLLEGIVTNPETSISQLPILTAAEQQHLLVEWNDTKANYPQDKCIHELFEEQVAKMPDAVAVVFEEEQLTYQELNNRANQLAHYLQKLGVGPEVLVGICAERSLEILIGLLGILKAGGAYVPLDPAYPLERLAFIIEDAQVPVLLTSQQLIAKLPQHQAKLLCLDRDWEKISQESEDNPVSGVQGNNLAYVIYTSGSTGKPKGCLINHGNVGRLFAATQSWFHFNERDVWTLFHSYAFDFSVWEMWGALLYGGRLVIVPYWVSRSPEAFYDLLCTQQVTVLNQTPSAFRQLIRAEEELRTSQELSLRLVIFGGEALELQSLKPWFERHGDQMPQLVNMYGITETTVHVTYRPLTLVDLNSTGSVIGIPIPDLQVYILDQNLQQVPIGVPGEMYVGGAGLARGYLNRPELTAERFIPNPFIDCPQARLYKSGDLARYLSNGDIEYLGRLDHQVKIRGFRIELGEIEARLTKHPWVREAIVLTRSIQPENQQLVAYVVPNLQEQSATSTEEKFTQSDYVNNPSQDKLARQLVPQLRHSLQQSLPDYMVPSAFVLLDMLPLTANGKVDRHALPAPDTSRRALEADLVAPRTVTEESLVEIWKDILGAEVGIYDNFFELGGHSLLATQVISRVRDAFSVELPLRSLFESPTVAQLAEQVEVAQLEQADEQELAQILTEVDELSNDELKKLLEE